MQRCEAVLVHLFKVGTHGQDVAQGVFGLRIAGPVKGGAPTIVLHIYVHVFKLYKIVQWTRLVSLSCYVEYIGSINIFILEISIHLFYYYFDQLNISVVSRKVKSGELFIGRLIDPCLYCFI